MGTYTKLRLFVQLKQDTPKEVIDLLTRVLITGDIGVKNQLFKHEEVFVPEIKHPFFKCERWEMLLLSTNFDESLKGGAMRIIGKTWCIFLDTEFKNYDNEIEQFIDWIKPYVKGRKKKQYLGWSKHENRDQEHHYVIR